ncbi:MAG: TolC family protein [Candidatus Omnitrophota bacterium]
MIRLMALILNIIIVVQFAVTPLLAEEEARKIVVVQVGLEEVIRMSLYTSEELKIKDNQVNKSEGIYKETRSVILPHLSAQSVWTNNMEYPVTADKKTDYALDSGINASQVLWSFGKVVYAVKSARQSLEAVKFNRESGRQEVIYAAKLGYYSTLLARNTLFITERSYANVLENKRLMGKRSYGGRSPKYEIIRMNAEAAARVPTVNEARAGFDAATETLKKMIDAGPDCKVALSGDFAGQYADFDYASLVSLMHEREPSLKSLNKNIESAEALVKSRYAGLLPTVSAFASLSRAGGSNEHSFLRGDRMDPYTSAGLKVDIPIWEGGAKEAQLSQSQADKEIAVLRRKQAGKELLLELKKAYLEYRQYKGNLAANIEAVNLAEESFKQSQEMFASGQISLADLNDAELLLTNQRLNKEMTLFNINITLAKIERLIAGEYTEGRVDEKA